MFHEAAILINALDAWVMAEANLDKKIRYPIHHLKGSAPEGFHDYLRGIGIDPGRRAPYITALRWHAEYWKKNKARNKEAPTKQVEDSTSRTSCWNDS